VNINKLFSTKEREKILRYVLIKRKSFRVTTVAKSLNISKGLVSQFLDYLYKLNVLKKQGSLYSVNFDFGLTKAIKILLNVSLIDVRIFKKIPNILGVGLYGSWAKGTNDVTSDVDIWIKLKKPVNEKYIAEIEQKLRERTMHDVSILSLYPEKLKRIKKEEVELYNSLFYNSIVLWGEGID